MALPCVRLVRLRSGALCRFLCRSSSHKAATAPEEIEVPRKKTWDKTAVLQALAYTVNHDPTSSSYVFQDDPYLLPKSSTDYLIYSTSKESGRNAAKYIMNMYPKMFERDIADPHIPCLMPENIQLQIEGISEEALTERIKLRRMKESVDMYDQLLQAGTPTSLQTTNRLLDLLCFYGDKEPTEESQANPDQENENAQDQKSPESKYVSQVTSWRKNNNAERIFNLMPEKDAHSFRTMIRGMAKHGAFTKAFDMYTDLLNNRLTGDVHTFNALIAATPGVKSEGRDRCALIVDLINQMVQQKVQPNLLTFNAILNSLRRTGLKGMAMQTVNEMKALNIEPSLATFTHLLAIFYKGSDSSSQAEILEEILDNIQGKSFTAQDPDDVKFFSDAIKVCMDTKDLELAYQVDALRNTGDNWKLLGSRGSQTFYYGKFFNIICLLENIDVVLKWYRENIPSRYSPNSKAIMNLLQVIEMENRLDLIPGIWKDLFTVGHLNKDYLFQEFLQIMTREKQNPQLQQAFANIAAAIKSFHDSAEYPSAQLKLSAAVLGNITILLCRAGRMEEVWSSLKSFKSQNLVPGAHVIDELMDGAKASGSTGAAVDLVQMAVSYSLPNTAKLAQKVLDEFTLTEEQRITLQDLTSSDSSSSSSSSSSGSSSDIEEA
ncbi:PREDICTED: pentatricopeptide repeat domain-containing protein 3, mitochondrial [Nanorana parkeri]|uniref:pentatricopeptide repeat domain-containing protein 3, mitochondrial n=1 Tax=Nanorana parkeri TaxID=125878 RepID=UPI000854FA06|nr:PREDICTED: pentatricopeptide repeat domain-containing protein 3, mitochondrial [Nanorana parkeri]